MSERQQVNIDDSNSFEGHHPQQMEVQGEAPINKSPLRFALRINGSYYISYKESQFWNMIIRSVAWAFLNWILYWIIQTFLDVGDTVKFIVLNVLIAQILLHLIICFVDAGTIFQDEEDDYGQERIYCITCKLYRKSTSKHCIWCNKCTKHYDHHCSIFGKCIGKRNLVPFWLFILVCGLEMPAMIVLLATHILGKL